MRRRRNPSLHRSKLIPKSFLQIAWGHCPPLKMQPLSKWPVMSWCLRWLLSKTAPAACPIRTVSFVLLFLFPYRSSFMSFSLRTFLCLRRRVCLFQDPSGGDQRSAGRGEEDGERRAAGHHLGASAHGQADPVHAVQHAGQRRPGQVLITHRVLDVFV